MPGFAKYGKGQKGVIRPIERQNGRAFLHAERLRGPGKATGSINPATDADELVGNTDLHKSELAAALAFSGGNRESRDENEQPVLGRSSG